MRLFILTLASLHLIPFDAGGQSLAVTPKLRRAPEATYDLHGTIRQRVDAVTANWLLKVPETNPAILQMFADRDNPLPRNLLPWSGEFAGKYLTGAVQVLRLTHDARLKANVRAFVAKLVRLQAEDGYLGPFPADNRLQGKNGTWDAWGHYHVMLGLLLWHEESGDKDALSVAVKIGDLLCRTFLNSNRRIVDTGNAEMNHAPIHSLCLLYRLTGTPRYLELARQIVAEFQDPRAGDYVRLATSGKEFFQGKKPRWESLHALQGVAELYWISGDESLRQTFEHLWWSIVKLDRHNNGGFSSGEQAQGNPYHLGAIETCCTVAWIATSIDMLRMTGSSIVADELELSTLNQVIGYQHPSGDNCTYNTPMNGIRRRSTEEIGFQIRPGSEEINCCSANAPRGFGMISDWALMSDGEGLVVNWYGPSTMTSLVNGTLVTLKQETTYPKGETISMQISPERNVRFPLKVRIPHWSAKSAVAVNGEPIAAIKPGSYVTLERKWRRGDTVTITLDMSLHYWKGEQEYAGKSSIYRGPLLLVHEFPQPKPQPIAFGAAWKRFGEIWATNEPETSFECRFEGTGVVWEGRQFDDAGKAQVTIDGKKITVVDQFGPVRDLPFTWETKGLDPGEHTIRVTVLAQQNSASKGNWTNVLKITPTPQPMPVLDAARLDPKALSDDTHKAQLIMDAIATDGSLLRLRDYGTAGYEGTAYASWLSVENVKSVPFSMHAPLRTSRFSPLQY
ncbi:beta-L-arabinofuranosidase domain-containing protein [Verrucomicrobiota bacterium sgz303538]